jgi:hypothetical protein
MISRKHDALDADLKKKVEEGSGKVEAAERVMDVLAQVGADRALQPAMATRSFSFRGRTPSA